MLYLKSKPKDFMNGYKVKMPFQKCDRFEEASIKIIKKPHSPTCV